MTDVFAGEGGFLGVCKDAFDQLHDATKDYEDGLDELENTGRIDFESIGEISARPYTSNPFKQVDVSKWSRWFKINFEDCHIKLSLDFRPRSSIWKTGLILSNCEGTIDELYRGEVMAYFYEVIKGKEKYKVGDRIGQIKLGFTLPIEFEEANELSESERGTNGFGSTGLN